MLKTGIPVYGRLSKTGCRVKITYPKVDGIVEGFTETTSTGFR